MACTGKIQALIGKNGEPVAGRGGFHWICEGTCPGGRKCEVIKGPKNIHGGYREWCGCPGESEPKGCHIVIEHPGPGEGGGPPRVLCAGDCDKPGEHCGPEPVVVEKIGGDGNDEEGIFACRCTGAVKKR